MDCAIYENFLLFPGISMSTNKFEVQATLILKTCHMIVSIFYHGVSSLCHVMLSSLVRVSTRQLSKTRTDGMMSLVLKKFTG